MGHHHQINAAVFGIATLDQAFDRNPRIAHGGRQFGKNAGSVGNGKAQIDRSEEHTSELQSLMRISYAVFCLKKKKKYIPTPTANTRKIQETVTQTTKHK